MPKVNQSIGILRSAQPPPGVMGKDTSMIMAKAANEYDFKTGQWK